MNPPATVPPPHHAGLDAVRGLAATAVVLVHVYQLFLLGGHVQSWARAGDAGVSVFFVLSGYLICASVVRDPAFSRRTFAIRRAARILPAYYVSLVIALVLVDATPLFTTGGRADVAAHLVLLHGLFPGMRYSINGVWWTLTVEVLFYALIALVAGVLRTARGGWIVVGAMVATALAWRHLVWSPDPTTTAYRIQQLPGVADLFAAGMALALAERAAWFRRLMARSWARIVVLAGTAVALPLVLWIYHANQPTYLRSTRLLLLWPLALGIAVAGLILCIRTWGVASDRIARRSGLALLGTLSFGIYLMHPFVIGAYGPAWFARNPDPPVVPFVLFALAGSVLTATGLHLWVERPGMDWGRRLTAPTRPTSPAPHPAPQPQEAS